MYPRELIQLARCVGTGTPNDFFDFQTLLPPPERVSALWDQTKLLTEAYGSYFRAGIPTMPTFTSVKDTRPGVLKVIARNAVAQVEGHRLNLGFLVKRFADAAEKMKQENPNGSASVHRFRLLEASADVLHENACYTRFKHLPNNQRNPLASVYKGFHYHTKASIFNPDRVDRVFPAYWTSTTPPNCLGNAVMLMAIARKLKLRFLFASALRLTSTDQRLLYKETFERALALTEKDALNPGAVARVKGDLAEWQEKGAGDWLFHHFILVECDAERHDWCVIDPYQGVNVFIPGAERLATLADALDERKTELPGLAVPISLSAHALVDRQRCLRNNLTRAEKHYNILVTFYLDLKQRLGHPLTLEQFKEAAQGEPAVAESLRWLVNKLTGRAAIVDPYILAQWEKGEHRGLKAHELRKLTFDQQLGYITEEGILNPVDWFLGRIVAAGMVIPCFAEDDRLSAMGHPSMEVYADPDHALGAFLINATLASSGFSLLSPEFPTHTSSQLIWHEAAKSGYTGDNVVTRIACDMAHSFIWSLPESRMHPLVHRWRRLDALKG